MTTALKSHTKAELVALLQSKIAECNTFREQVSQLVADNDRLRTENAVLRQGCEAEDEHAAQRSVADGRDVVEAEPMVLTQRDYAPEAKNRLKAYAGVVAAYTKAATRIDWSRGKVQYYVKATREWRDAK